jgi:hypothetical protein
MATGNSMNNIMNSLIRKICIQSDPFDPLGHIAVVTSDGKDVLVEVAGVELRMLYNTPRGIAVRSNGKNITVKMTILFLNTSAHSFRTIVIIFFIVYPQASFTSSR